MNEPQYILVRVRIIDDQPVHPHIAFAAFADALADAGLAQEWPVELVEDDEEVTP